MDHQNDGSQPTGIADSGVVMVNEDEAAQLDSPQMHVLRIEHPDRGVLHVPWPLDVPTPTLDEVVASLGEPGEVKGPSARVWGDEHAEQFGLEPLLGVMTPQGDGEPVKGPGDEFAADEVVTEPQE